MAVPTIISMLVTSIYNIVDTYFVGLLNTQATAAVGVVFPVMAIIQAVGFYFGSGSGTFISRTLGARDVHSARVMASTGFFSALFFGALITVLGLLFLKPLSLALGSTPTILPYTERYLGGILLGAPFLTASMTLNNQMRFQGNANQAMYGMMTGAALNVVLVPFFMFVLNMGILGTAIGTVSSQIVAFVVLLVMASRGDNIAIRWGDMKFDERCTKRRIANEMFRGGTPSLTRQGLASVATMMLNVAAGAFGDAAIAGMSIVMRIINFVFSTMLGIGQGYQPFCGFNYGAKNFSRLRKGYIFSLKLCVAIIVILGIPSFIFAEEIIYFLRHDAAVVEVGATAFRWQLVSLPLCAFVVMTNMTLQTSGRAFSANFLSAARNGIYFIPLILLLPRFLGILGVEICQAVADVLSCATAVPLAWYYFRSLKNS
ncbi:MAG: MATE family efflux transporter [Bacteroidaceae bacterium]|nr:MATE family efflux transporter [Bacteroidaceae bacterium]MBQ3628291.1 MATE family efflux transporter [Bacteroidaceae bacterium]